MGRKLASKLIAEAKKRAGVKPITAARAKRIAAFKPFSHPVRTMMKGAMGGMPRAPRAPRQFGAPPRRRTLRVK
jgi:hypothetical protein